MKFKIIPEHRRTARKFKSDFVSIPEAAKEIQRLIDVSTNNMKGKEILAKIVFEDKQNGELETSIIPFKQGASTNVSYYATKMLEEKYSNAPREIRDAFLNTLKEELEGTEKIDHPVEATIPKEQEQVESKATAVSRSMTECPNCQEDIEENVKYCPYCGFDQTTDLTTIDETLTEEEIPSMEHEKNSSEGFDISQTEYEEVEVEQTQTTPPSSVNDTVQTGGTMTYSDVDSSRSTEVAPLWVNNLPSEIQNIIARGKQFRGKTTIRAEIFEKYKNPQSEEITRKTTAILDEEQNALYAAEQEFIENKRRIAQDFEQKRQFETQKIKDSYSERINKEIEATLEAERSKAKSFTQDMETALNQLIENT